jgi:hypothetical protein
MNIFENKDLTKYIITFLQPNDIFTLRSLNKLFYNTFKKDIRCRFVCRDCFSYESYFFELYIESQKNILKSYMFNYTESIIYQTCDQFICPSCLYKLKLIKPCYMCDEHVYEYHMVECDRHSLYLKELKDSNDMDDYAKYIHEVLLEGQKVAICDFDYEIIKDHLQPNLKYSDDDYSDDMIISFE